jgi:hypothetical protein
MARHPKLTDLQLILLTTATQRDHGSLFPVAESVAKHAERIGKAIPTLLKRSLIEERPTRDRRIAWREQDDQPIGVFVTPAGRRLIEPAGDAAESVAYDTGTPKSQKKNGAETVRKRSKAELVLGLLRRPNGATLNELVTATCWLPHTTRAALTGLRKKGHVVEKTKRDDATCYRIAEVA